MGVKLSAVTGARRSVKVAFESVDESGKITTATPTFTYQPAKFNRPMQKEMAAETAAVDEKQARIAAAKKLVNDLIASNQTPSPEQLLAAAEELTDEDVQGSAKMLMTLGLRSDLVDDEDQPVQMSVELLLDVLGFQVTNKIATAVLGDINPPGDPKK